MYRFVYDDIPQQEILLPLAARNSGLIAEEGPHIFLSFNAHIAENISKDENISRDTPNGNQDHNL
jgi:hypothetical protein